MNIIEYLVGLFDDAVPDIASYCFANGVNQ